MSSYDVPKCSYGQGSVRAASGTILGVLRTSKMKENERFYGFTEFRGKPAGRGRDSHATLNQVTAGFIHASILSRKKRRKREDHLFPWDGSFENRWTSRSAGERLTYRRELLIRFHFVTAAESILARVEATKSSARLAGRRAHTRGGLE